MFYGFGYGSSTQYILYLLGILLAVIAQGWLSSTYSKYRAVANARGLSGAECARYILHRNGLDHIRVEMSRGGTLSDHYDPRAGVIRLSADIYQGTSIASLSVAAHECGHAIQHKENYAPLKIRDTMVPVVNLANQIGWVALFLGLVLFYRSSTLLMVGGIMLLVVLAFQLITLPVELNASSRALKILRADGMIMEQERPMASTMLKAAAFTYVASVLSTLLQILRVFLIAGSRDRRN
ncbi:MAG TPA: zinc metallopeptidase [Candidatus Merdibacter merdavium]|uniref:Zinc metallopeptidase n=1 Tax=Candidatus Merdibacter merdavium TaxID=2838692 RepID=A0A9D2NQS7_9FIRM|nr:zinc metallopeptidase [Candidatus Merdibacter merdavium]